MNLGCKYCRVFSEFAITSCEAATLHQNLKFEIIHTDPHTENK